MSLKSTGCVGVCYDSRGRSRVCNNNNNGHTNVEHNEMSQITDLENHLLKR